MVCSCPAEKAFNQTKRYARVHDKKGRYHKADQTVVIQFKSRSTAAPLEPYQTELSNAHFKMILRDYYRTGDWRGSYALHPMGGEESRKSRGHSDGALISMPSLPKGYGKIENVDTAPLQAGVYMPEINLHKGFEFVCNLARNDLKRELTRKERKPLFEAYVKACNAYQLICLPDQSQMPFQVCAGSVWQACEGCIAQFSLLVEKALKRQMTRKEGIFIKAQWQALTRRDRAKVTGRTLLMKNAGDTASKFRTMGEVWKEGGNTTKDFIYQNFQSTKQLRFDQKIIFDYNAEVARLRKLLKANKIDHGEYNNRLAVVRAKRDQVLDALKHSELEPIRNMHKNSSTIRTMHNAKGMEPERPVNQSKRFAPDGLVVDEDCSEYRSGGFGEDLRTPTIWKDGKRRN